MKIGFLGLGRMGRILCGHLIEAGHDVTCWNRTGETARQFADRAKVAAEPAEAIAGNEVVFSCLFGPQSVHEVFLDHTDVPFAEGAVWVDISTVGPFVAAASAEGADTQSIGYVHSPVLGSLGPAANKDLGVLIGGTDAANRSKARELVSLWADPDRIIEYDSAAKAAVAKLVVNLSLAIGMQGLIESMTVAEAGGLTQAEALQLAGLPKTVFAAITAMKGSVVADRAYANTQFSTNLLAKDVDLMLSVAEGQSLPALRAAFSSLEHARRAGHGEDDFSSMAGENV